MGLLDYGGPPQRRMSGFGGYFYYRLSMAAKVLCVLK